jgi:DNA-binding transcriptional LysR family regulator
MELRHLRYFIAAAEEEHFGRASEKLHVTRPAVSQIIADLEAELEIQLFERKAHRVKLTPAGRKLLPDIKAVMYTLTEAIDAARKVSEGKSGTLIVGYGTLTLHNTLFRDSIKRFRERHPDVSLRLVGMATHQQPQALAEGRIHVGFMHFGMPQAAPLRERGASYPPVDETHLTSHTIETGSLGVIMETSHPLAGRAHLTLEQLASERFVVVTDSGASPGYGMLFSLCQQAGFEPDVMQEVDSISTLLNLVAVNLGVALIVMGRNFTYPPPLHVVPVRGVGYSTRFSLGWLKDRRDPLIDALLQTVKEAAASR